MAIDFNRKVYILDGAMGTMLQRNGMPSGVSSVSFALEHPEILKNIHAEYVSAGSDIIYAPTFGLNRMVAEELGYPLPDAVSRLMAPAFEVKADAAATGREVLVALDLSPQGELLEPMGSRSFDDAYDIFTELVIEGVKCGADLIVIETMIDLYEAKAAMLAAKEHSSLPVIVSLTFETTGRTFTGSSIEAMAVTMEALGASAIGMNCSLGPAQILPLAKNLLASTSLPVFAKPNAGLPDPDTGGYDIDASEFAGIMKDYIEAGISMVGGCCGTDPSYIKGIAERRDALGNFFDGKRSSIPAVSSSSKVVRLDGTVIVGDRLNPAGKKQMQDAIANKDFDYVMSQAVAQIEAGAHILEVSADVPGVDEASVLPELVKKLQSITNLPLQICTSNAKALEAALRIYNGKALVSAVNGKDEVLDEILPLVANYGAAVVGVTIDENGIPNNSADRVNIAKKILAKAQSYGISAQNIVIDCVTLTASSNQEDVKIALDTVDAVSSQLGLSTTLNIAGVSFGFPQRELINRAYLVMALSRGLNLAVMNPVDEDLMAAAFAYDVLGNLDPDGTAYSERYAESKAPTSRVRRAVTSTLAKTGSTPSKRSAKLADDTSNDSGIIRSVVKGLEAETADEVRKLLNIKSAMAIINEDLIPALNRVGKDFESGKLFLPEMLQSAQAAQVGFDVIKADMEKNNIVRESAGKAIIATVKGDIHDIGKNIVKVIMENYGFDIMDLGRDVSPEDIVTAALENDIKMVGLSALMTTTLGSMKETIQKLKAAIPDCKVMVGGAVLTADYAQEIGADYYCSDAMKSVEAAQEVFEK